jgi:ankyrin repeat protein
MNSHKRTRQRQLTNDSLAGNAGSVAKAIKSGVDVDSRDAEHGETALTFALMRSRDAVVELLLRARADVNARDLRMRTPLMYAHGMAVETLVNEGADLNARDEDGLTALMHRINHADFETCIELINNGADVSLQNDDGETALTMATAYGFVAIQRLLTGV